MSFKAIVIGCSAGGLRALEAIIPPLPANFPIPIIIVQHQWPKSDNFLRNFLNQKSHLKVKMAEEKEYPKAGIVYLAPPDYHLMIEQDQSLSLSLDQKVNYARPSIDVLFETAAEVYGKTLIGIILTGASSDGTEGLNKVKLLGGHALIQDPSTADANAMPQSALDRVDVDSILPLNHIAEHLIQLCQELIV